MEARAPEIQRQGMMKRLFDRIMVLSAGKHALWLLAVVSFTEASFFPIPPDGYGLYETLGAPVIAFYNLQEAFHAFQTRFDEWGGWIIVAKGLTPIPFKLVTIASGVAHLNLWTFVIACVITRGLRFLLVAGLFYAFGPQARAIIDRHFSTVMILGTILVILGFVAIVYI
jgi:membrane protein YqaA with SNARE-associated domain